MSCSVGRVAEAVVHPYRDLVKPGVRFVQTAIRSIHPDERRVETDAGRFDADVMVVALGADLDPAATPGLVEGGHEFYTVPGAFALRDVLADFEGGHVIVGVTSVPFKCPPAPSETALLMHDFLTERGLRDNVGDLARHAPRRTHPTVARRLRSVAGCFRRARHHVVSRSNRAPSRPRQQGGPVCRREPNSRTTCSSACRCTRCPRWSEASDLCVDGWIPVDPLTLETSYPGVYAVGDVTSVGTPKAGVFAEGQAAVVAAGIIAREAGDRPSAAYDGHGQCYLEFGHDQVARVDVTFTPGKAPSGTFEAPSNDLAEQKSAFGTTRIQRWFGHDWSAF